MDNTSDPFEQQEKSTGFDLEIRTILLGPS